MSPVSLQICVAAFQSASWYAQKQQYLTSNTFIHFLLQAKAAAHQLGFHVRTVDCELATDAHEQPLEPDYIWQHDEDSEHEKQKVVARLSQELDLSSNKLQQVHFLQHSWYGE